jgi:hypothetical protein
MYGLGVLVLATLLSCAPGAGEQVADPQPQSTPLPATELPASGGVSIARNSSCASDCQTQHDRCRVVTKGSRTCDEDRQRCLEICLQKKKK